MDLQTLSLATATPVGTSAASAPSGRTDRASRATLLRRVVFFAVLLLAWDSVARYGPWPDRLLPGPAAVGDALLAGFRSGGFLQSVLVSVVRLLIGYAISMVGGILLGTLLVRYKALQETVGALIVGMQALPSVCWLPLALLWFGLNERAIIFVVVMGSLFSIVLGVQAGITNTPPTFVKAARNLGARGVRLYVQVILPAAFPTILSGLKQGWAFAWRSLMAGELLFFSLSLGNLLNAGRTAHDSAQIVAVMLLIVAIGVAFNQILFAPIERRVAERWGFGVTGA